MKRNANIADFFKPVQRPKDSRLNATGRLSDSTISSSAPSSRVSHLLTPNPTPAVDTPPEPYLPSSDSAPASSPPSPQQSSVPTTRVASFPTSQNPLLDPHSPAQPRPEANSPSPEMLRSSFSSLPPLSQTSNTSSRRVVRDGVEIVRTSDSEEDSDSSLEDLSVLLAARKRSAPVESSSPARPSLSPRVRSRKDYNFRSQAKRPKKLEKILSKPTKYKISLAAMAKQASKERAAEAKSREAEEAAEKLEELLKDDRNDEITEHDLLDVVGDEDRAREAREALERTGALETFQVWRFFGSCRSTTRSRPFPTSSLPSQGWQTLLKDTATRENALQSGLVQAGVVRNALPDEIISWVVDEVCFGTKTELKCAYLRVLESSNTQIGNLLDKDRIQQLFSRMGASVGTCGPEVSLPNIVPTEVQENEPRPAPHAGLTWLLRLLRQSASQLTPEALEYGLEVLVRANFDDCVLADVELQNLGRDAVGTFLAVLGTSFNDVARRIYTSLRDNPALQSHLIASLPAHTPLECNFRRRLALCFLLQNSTAALTTPMTSRAFLESIFAAILNTNPHFRMHASTDFANVAALANILDVAVDTGFSNFNFSTVLASIPRKLTFRDADAKVRRQEALRLEEEFNAGIDKLVRLLHMVNDQMKSGIKNMIQSEAKVTLDRVEHRIEYGVRTQDVSTRDVYEEMGYGAQSSMERWIKTERMDSEKDQHKEQGSKKVSFADENADGKLENDSREPSPNGKAAENCTSSELEHEVKDEEQKESVQNATAPRLRCSRRSQTAV
ncbi:hypothetical protein BKA81DRAFT_372564 [Phyllosticta paracitricarpa]|uniref:Uncharacterized protein n=1 Tax=Phyllosticta paracitricarpa TaxID=2016321 RepID=A0ABR1MU51_9PEZI